MVAHTAPTRVGVGSNPTAPVKKIYLTNFRRENPTLIDVLGFPENKAEAQLQPMLKSGPHAHLSALAHVNGRIISNGPATQSSKKFCA